MGDYSTAKRTAVALLTLAASTLVGIAGYEGYRETAYIPVPGDVPTIGFGTTKNVKMGDRITPDRALRLLAEEIDSEYVKGVKRCVKVPLTDYEFGSMISFAYNVGVGAFCSSTLVKKLNSGDYKGACNEMNRWIYVKGRRVQGLVNRRAEESAICRGERR